MMDPYRTLKYLYSHMPDTTPTWAAKIFAICYGKTSDSIQPAVDLSLSLLTLSSKIWTPRSDVGDLSV